MICRKSVALVLLIPVALVAISACNKGKKKKEDPPLSVEVIRSVKRDLLRTLDYTGDIKGESEVKVYSSVPDRIKKLYVDIGDKVKKGQLLAIVEHTRLRLAVSQVKSQLAAAKSNLAAARVRLSGAKVQRSSTRREYLRIKRLRRSGAVGEQQLDLARAKLDGARTQVKAAREQINALKAQIAALRAGVGQARSARRNALIYSPISGVVGRRNVNEGDRAVPQIPLFTIVRMNKVKVTVNVSGKDIGKVSPGMKVSITVEAYPKKTFQGKVSKIAPVLDLSTRTAPTEIVIDNSSLMLKPGMFCTASILLGKKTDAVVMPLTALLNNSFGYSSARHRKNLKIMVINGSGKPDFRRVTIGMEVGKLVEVTSGLKPGEKVVVVGHNLYKPGQKIKIVKERRI